MPLYHYEARDSEGSSKRGSREAASEQDLRELLALEQLVLIEAALDESTAVGGETFGRSSSAELGRKLTSLISAGLASPGDLRAVARETGASGLRFELFALADRLERGESLETALDALGDRVAPHVRGLISASIRSGNIPELVEAAEKVELVGSRIRRAILMPLMYPAILFCLFLAVSTAYSRFVIRGFEDIYSDFGMDMPIVSRFLFRMSSGLAEIGVPLLVIAIVATVLILFRPWRGILPQFTGWLDHVPLIGPMLRWAALAEFSYVLSALLGGRVVMAEAVELAGKSTRGASISGRAAKAAMGVSNGRSLGESAYHADLYPEALARFVGWAERGGVLPETLLLVGEILEARAASRARFLSTFVVVFLVILSAFGVVLLIVGALLPMLRLVSALGM